MHLYFLRHGKAENTSKTGADYDRCLTEEGVLDMRKAASGIVSMNVVPDIIFSSPLPRALQTANIVMEELAYLPSKLIVSPRLESGNLRIGTLQSLLADRREVTKPMFVGHEPDLSELISQFCGATVDMTRGGLACVQISQLEPGCGVLKWLLTGRQLTLVTSHSR